MAWARLRPAALVIVVVLPLLLGTILFLQPLHARVDDHQVACGSVWDATHGWADYKDRMGVRRGSACQRATKARFDIVFVVVLGVGAACVTTARRLGAR